MWFQALECAASCTVVKYFFTVVEQQELVLVFEKSALVLPLAPRIETRPTKFHFLDARADT